MPFGGGILQLVAKGQQDVFLTGNPEMTFFKMVYKRHTNFSITQRRVFFDGTPDFGQRVVCTIPPGMGDLLGKTYLHVVLPRLVSEDVSGNTEFTSYCASIGHALIQDVTLYIGEQEINRQNGEWMEIWTQLTTPASQVEALNTMVGRVDGYTPPSLIPGGLSGLELWIPLQLFFCRDSNLYIPLMAIQYYKIKIAISIANVSRLFYSPELVTNPSANIRIKPTSIKKFEIVSEFINLDTEERRRFVSSPHEYLIEQVQYTPVISLPTGQSKFVIDAHFTNCIKEIYLLVQRDAMLEYNQHFNYSSLALDESTVAIEPIIENYFPPDSILRTSLIQDVMLQLDGIDCFDEPLSSFYLSTVQPYQYHTATPVNRFIHTYSFALYPEKITPSGTVNASRVNSFKLNVNMNPIMFLTGMPTRKFHTRVYALGYNVLRIVDGFAGILFKT